MKKLFIIALLGASLVLAGCAQQTPTGNKNTNQPTVDINQNINQPIANQNTNQQPDSKPQVTDGIATYKNSKYDFGFQYDSKNYKVTEINNAQWGGPEFTDAVNVKALTGGDCSKGLIIIASLSTLSQELSDLDFRISGTITKITINGLQATKKTGVLTENQPPCGNEYTDVVFEHNNKVFVIRADKQSDDLLNSILTTFKF